MLIVVRHICANFVIFLYSVLIDGIVSMFHVTDLPSLVLIRF